MLNTAPRVINIVLSANANNVDTNAFVCELGAEYEVVEVSEVHSTLGTDAGAVTLDLKKCTGTTAPNAGTSVLSSTFDMKSTINTVVSKTAGNGGLVSALATRTVRPGERLALDFTGTITALAGLAISIVLRQRRKATNR